MACSVTDPLLATAFLEYTSRTQPKLQLSSPAQRRFANYFRNLIVLNGKLPNPFPLKLHHITMATRADFDGTAVQLSIHDNEGMLYESRPTKKSSFAFKNPISLSADVMVRMSTRKGVAIMEFSFHTGFMSSGLIRVSKADLDQSFGSSSDSSVYEGMDLVFSDFAGLPINLIPGEEETMQLRGQSYTKYMDTTLNKCLVRLVNNHSIRVQKPDVSLLVRETGVDKEVCCFSLQIHKNKVDSSKRWLLKYNFLF